MKLRILFASIAVFAIVNSASAQVFPRHEDICVGGIVSKEKLAKAFLKVQPDWLNLYIDSVESANNPQRQPQWRRIFIDRNFCKDNPACLSLDKDVKPPKRDTVAAEKTLVDLRRAFENSLMTETRSGKPYSVADPTIGTAYFTGANSQNAIQCLGNEPPVAAKAPPGIKVPFRLRANADDLHIDGTDPAQKAAFKSVKPATINFTRDGADQKTNTTKLQATLGVPIPLGAVALPYMNTLGISSFTGELVPYFSASQSITKVDGKSATYADTNVVATGALFSSEMTLDSIPGINHTLMAKPQYLWNTKDKSEIASARIIYQPWGNGILPSLNTPSPLTTVDGSWIQFPFDLRYDVGTYTKKGNDPTTAANHTSFQRGGTKFGVSVTTPALGPYMTLTATETLLYGFSGEVRNLSLFDLLLSIYLDSTGNVAFTTGYTTGRDEDTAERKQTVTMGFSAKF